jgi:hypothetical protein
MGVTKQLLEQAWVDFGSKYGGVKEDYFAMSYLVEQFGGTTETYAHEIAFGNNDYGLDAFHLDRDRRNLYLYQFKWSENHQLFKESLKRLTSAGMERVFGDPLQDQQVNQFILQLKQAIDENQAIVDRIYINFVFNGDPEAAEKSVHLEALREDLEAKKFLVDQFFQRPVGLTVQFISNETRKLGGIKKTKKTHSYSFALPSVITTMLEGGETMSVGFIPVLELYRMHREMGYRLFARNIRAGLGGDRSPNRAIKATLGRILSGEESPNIFAFNHNGVTISAEAVSFKDGVCTVVEPRVLNGAQTITSVNAFMEENEKNQQLEQNRDRLAALQILARIIATNKDDLVVNITICNNRQNPVEPWNLRASDSIQLQLEDKFREELSMFYERQENSFESHQDSDLAEMGIEHKKAIQIKRLAQTFLALQGEVDRMSRLPDVFESEKLYRETFRDSYLKADGRKILLAYKIQFRLRRIVQEIVEKGYQKYFFMERARYLVWALLIQGILNDPRLEEYCEAYGKDSVIDANYSEILKDIASKRVRFIVSEAVSDPKSQALIEEEKYGFLRTKAIFIRCMDHAFDKWAWKKRAL